jgi:hypothetical protein
MTTIIKLHEAQPGKGLAVNPLRQQGRLRLNLFAGRSLGEREFDLLQRYHENRLAPLLAGYPSGVVEGLELTVTGLGDSDPVLRLSSGLAVGGDGKIINMVFPLDQAWSVQVDDYKQRRARSLDPITAVHGIYWLTVRRELEAVDRSKISSPCIREEADRLRDARIETVTSLSLQPIETDDTWVTDARTDKTLTINRILSARLKQPLFDAETGAVPVAMVAVENDTLLWMDVSAGRLPARNHSNYWVFLAHTREALTEHFSGLHNASAAEKQAAIDTFNLEQLPAAGILPQLMLSDIATTPTMSWLPQQLQIELSPIAESQVQAVIERELPRSSLELSNTNFSADRIRLLAAVPDENYRDDLFDLPFPDLRLAQDLYRYGQIAGENWKTWLAQYDLLFNLVSEEDLLSDRGKRLFQVPERIDLNSEGKPVLPEEFFNQLLTDRAGWETFQSGINDQLPAPYNNAVPPPPADYSQVEEPIAPTEPGLLKQYLDLGQEIDNTETLIEDLAQLLELYKDMQRLQRQQMDHVSLSFTRLAGGVPGDGTGLPVARWLPDMKFAKITPVGGDDNG